MHSACPLHHSFISWRKNLICWKCQRHLRLCESDSLSNYAKEMGEGPVEFSVIFSTNRLRGLFVSHFASYERAAAWNRWNCSRCWTSLSNSDEACVLRLYTCIEDFLKCVARAWSLASALYSLWTHILLRRGCNNEHYVISYIKNWFQFDFQKHVACSKLRIALQIEYNVSANNVDSWI